MVWDIFQLIDMFPRTSNGEKQVDLFLANLNTVDMFPEPKVRTGRIVDMFLAAILRTGTENDYLFHFLVPLRIVNKLMQVLGESYTSKSYAFLVDSDGIIINHPNKAYENNSGSGVRIGDTEYAECYNSADITVLRDFISKWTAEARKEYGDRY